MNVRTLCLAILHHQDATGYEIRKLSTEGKYAYFVDASFGSIYPALAKLEDEGLVTCRLEQQDGKPARKVYSINQAGRDALRGSLKDEPTPDVFRSEFLLIGMCSDLLEPGDMERTLNVHTAQVEQELAKLDDMKANLVDSEKGWLHDYGTTCMRAQLTWLHANRERILNATKNDGCSSAPADPPLSTAAE
ncbi:MAG: PadR family transcriptional regulator [Devosiaceae bacterium]